MQMRLGLAPSKIVWSGHSGWPFSCSLYTFYPTSACSIYTLLCTWAHGWPKDLHIFWPSVCLLWRNVYLVSHPFFIAFFFFFKLSCRSYLCILEINPLSVTSFANILSHFEGCLLLLFMVSFAMQKLLRIIKPYLFIFVFTFITLGKWSHSVVSYSLRSQGL